MAARRLRLFVTPEERAEATLAEVLGRIDELGREYDRRRK